jgi:hypothetical protein
VSIWTVVDQVPRLVTLIRSVLTEREAAATASDRGQPRAHESCHERTHPAIVSGPRGRRQSHRPRLGAPW